MPTKTKSTSAKATKNQSQLHDEVQRALAWLERKSSKATRDGMARYGIPSDNAFGVSVAKIHVLAKRLGRNHELAAALWLTGRYEARMLTSFIDEPERVTPAQMDRWCRDFDSWAIVDTVCFHLFDRTPHAWQKVPKWCNRREEFVKRAGFVLMACLALHDKTARDAQFLVLLPLVEEGSHDDRNFVKKGVSWALRSIGRRNLALNTAALKVAKRLAVSEEAACRWVGKDALRELASPKVLAQLARRANHLDESKADRKKTGRTRR